MSEFIASARFGAWVTLVFTILAIIIAGLESGHGLGIFYILATTALVQTLGFIAIIWAIATTFKFLATRS